MESKKQLEQSETLDGHYLSEHYPEIPVLQKELVDLVRKIDTPFCIHSPAAEYLGYEWLTIEQQERDAIVLLDERLRTNFALLSRVREAFRIILEFCAAQKRMEGVHHVFQASAQIITKTNDNTAFALTMKRVFMLDLVNWYAKHNENLSKAHKIICTASIKIMLDNFDDILLRQAIILDHQIHTFPYFVSEKERLEKKNKEQLEFIREVEKNLESFITKGEIDMQSVDDLINLADENDYDWEPQPLWGASLVLEAIKSRKDIEQKLKKADVRVPLRRRGDQHGPTFLLDFFGKAR